MTDTSTYNPWMETRGGRHFHFLTPSEDEIDINDISYALSNLCRYTGHSKAFYSVAEHSIYVASLLPSELQLAGLLHDAEEAFIGDVSSPLKMLLPEYKKIAKGIEKVIEQKFKVDLTDARIKHADRQQLRTEAHFLLESRGEDWDIWGTDAYPVAGGRMPKALPPQAADRAFMMVYKRLTNQQEDVSKIILAA